MSEKVILSINKLSFGYTKEKEVLKDINLDLKDGEILGILGASGIGKSSLLRIIVGLEVPNRRSLLSRKLLNKKTMLFPLRKEVSVWLFKKKLSFPT